MLQIKSVFNNSSCFPPDKGLSDRIVSRTFYRSHYKKLTDWAKQIVFQLRRWLPNRYLVVVADYSYAVLEFLAACQELSDPVTIITRLRLNAALYQPAPPYSGIGRPRKKGERLPNLADILHNPSTQWQNVTLDRYNGQQKEMQIVSPPAVRYHTGKPPVSIHWVLIRDPLGKYEPIALLSTDTTLCPNQIANWYVRRWWRFETLSPLFIASASATNLCLQRYLMFANHERISSIKSLTLQAGLPGSLRALDNSSYRRCSCNSIISL